MSASKRKPIRRPGKKSGARINNTLAIKPLGIKTATTYELSAHAALLALDNDSATQDHLVNLYVLADLADRIGGEFFVQQHAATIKRLCDQIHGDAYHCGHLTYVAMRASTDVLLRWVLTQKNIEIAKHARRAVQELSA